MQVKLNKHWTLYSHCIYHYTSFSYQHSFFKTKSLMWHQLFSYIPNLISSFHFSWWIIHVARFRKLFLPINIYKQKNNLHCETNKIPYVVNVVVDRVDKLVYNTGDTWPAYTMRVSYLGVERSLGQVAQTNKNLSKYLIKHFYNINLIAKLNWACSFIKVSVWVKGEFRVSNEWLV